MDTARASASPARDAALIFGLTFAAAAIGAVTSVNAPAFYAQLTKPSWAPAAAAFGPIWTALYMLMALAAWLALREATPPFRSSLLRLYVAQLVVNALWTSLFFRWRLGAAALVDVVVLCVLVVLTTWRCSQARRASGVLMLPYAMWVTFASALTFAVWRLNPQLL